MATVVGALNDWRIRESSGLAAGIRHPEVLWTHNDSGGKAAIYAVDAATAKVLAEVIVSGVGNTDWEAIGCGRSTDGTPVIYIADVGNNGAWRKTVTIYVINEPAEVKSQTVALHGAPWQVKYADGPRDSDAFVVDSSRNAGGLWIISKEKAPYTGGVYSVPYHGGVAARNGNVREWVTDAALSPDSRKMVLRSGNYASAYRWPFDKSTRKDFMLPSQAQGEGMTYSRDGKYVYLSSEGSGNLLRIDAAAEVPAV